MAHNLDLEGREKEIRRTLEYALVWKKSIFMSPTKAIPERLTTRCDCGSMIGGTGHVGHK